VTIDKSGANLAALLAVNAGRDAPIKIRQIKYLNNVVEQDHLAIKRMIRPTPRRKRPWGMLRSRTSVARVILILSRIEIMHMIARGQMKHTGKIKLSATCQFYLPVTQAILIILSLYDSTALARQNPKLGSMKRTCTSIHASNAGQGALYWRL
jgi:hypothetical protein